MNHKNMKTRQAAIQPGNRHKCGATPAEHGAFRLKPLAQAISWTLMMGASGAYAAITVDTNVDEPVGTTLGTCTLREAVQSANDDDAPANTNCTDGSGNDDIVFNITPSGTITLSQGEIFVTEALTITGPVAGQTVSGNDASRIFRH
ncbi:MAG: CSLREA domain-containing protein, partial [Proteobacteria bacterium]|nr:CSLREA domain-containing protein [Pseudomonadota bacterium]